MKGVYQGNGSYLVKTNGYKFGSTYLYGSCANIFRTSYAFHWEYVASRSATREVPAYPAVTVAGQVARMDITQRCTDLVGAGLLCSRSDGEKLKISHADSGSRLFVPRAFRSKEVLRFYYGLRVPAELPTEQYNTNTYGEGVMQVTVEAFGKWAKDLPGTITDKPAVDHNV